MPNHKTAGTIAGLLASLAMAGLPAHAVAPYEHREFDATLQAPFRAPQDGRARSIALQFTYPEVERAQAITWRLDLLTPDGHIARRWFGHEKLFRQPVDVDLPWDGRRGGMPLPDGIYQLRLRALAQDAGKTAGARSLNAAERTLASHAGGILEQRWDISVGQLTARAMPAFDALPGPSLRLAPAPGALPYTVYYANLHSQTRHSDGGGPLDRCHGAQPPQSAPFGPLDAYQFARNHGLDILATTEHNHMYDGSDGTNSAADPAVAKALYREGQADAAAFNAAHPDFLAVYGQEWGVIAKGGHLNIFNSNQLLGWEMNGHQQLLADTLTPKSDYASLYALMRERDWIGQFNHPAQNGQFLLEGKSFGYSTDGDQAMALCEVMNTSAFSTNISETETHRSNYELACNKALEAGFHLAFSSNQDNHCANWGAAYTNRTGILIPRDTPLSQASLLEALRARRVFATMDKQSQLVFSANGHLMGERFDHTGALTLSASFANLSGRSVAAIAIYQGVPGRNGNVTLLSSDASTTLTPADGEHFYYARLTQDDGKILWSAPLWVTQKPAAPP